MSDYYRDGDRPHEGHHSGPPRRDEYEPRERRGDERPDFYSHEGGERGERREHGGEKEKKKDDDDDHEVLGTLAGAVAGGLGGHALGGKAGHGVAGGLLGAVAGAFVGHEAEEKVEDWKEKRDEKKRDEEEERGERERRDEGQQHHRREGGGGGGGEFRHHGGEGVEVTVQPGDTLRGIAARFEGVSFEDIARHNNISNPDLIYPGQVLRVPARREY